MKQLKSYTLFDGEAIEVSGSITSEFISLKDHNPEGFFSVYLKTVGASSQVKVEYMLSQDGKTPIDAGTDIATGLTPDLYIMPFPDGEPYLAPYIQIVVTEIAGNAVSSCDCVLNIQ